MTATDEGSGQDRELAFRREVAARVREPRIGVFAALSIPQYARLFTTGLFVFMAVQAQQIARGQLAYDLTGSNAGLGGVYLGFGVPMLLVTPLGGVAADRLPKRRVLLVAQAGLVVSALWIAVADTLDFIEYWMLIGAAAVQASAFAVYGPTRVAYTGEVVESAMLPNAVVLTQMGLNATRVFAPALAGVLIGITAIGTHGVYQLTVVLMIVAFTITWKLPRVPVRTDRPYRTVRAEILDGVRYVRADSRLSLLVLTSFVMVMVGWPYLAFLPSISNDLFDAGSAGYGVMSSVSAVAALLVTIWLAGKARPARLWSIQTLSGFLLGGGLILVALSPNFALALVALLIVGGAASGYQAMNNTLVLTIADLEYHGRVQSLLMLSFSGFGIAALPLGALADAVGLRTTFAGMGGLCIVTMVASTIRRRSLNGAPARLEDAPA